MAARPDPQLPDADVAVLEQFTSEEAEAIATEPWRRRLLDRELARLLSDGEPTAPTATGRCDAI